MLRRSLQVLRRGRYLCYSSTLKLHTSAFPVLYSKFDKDLPNPTQPVPVNKLYGPDTDILYEQLKKCHSIDHLLELLNMHLDVMNSKHIVACLDAIHDCLKDDKELARSLTENNTFKTFCSRLMKVIKLFEPQEVITAYKTFCTMEIRNNTYIMQCILKMLGAHLNNMTLGQLIFLSYLLHKQRHNPLVDGLKLAIPLVVQVQIDQQLDSDRVTDVVNCLQLACRANLKTVTIQKIMKAVIQKASSLSTEDAITVIFGMLQLEAPVDGYNELINIAFEIVSQDIEGINSQKICTILRTCRYQGFYHYKFFKTASDFIVSQKWDLELTYRAVNQLHHLSFCDPKLLDHFAERLHSESKAFHNSNSYSVISCVEPLTATSYRPTNIDEAARVLYSDESKFEQLRMNNPFLYFKFHTSLAMLGHFPRESLSKVISKDSLLSIFSHSRKIGRALECERHLLSLFWSLQLYDEEENFTIPPVVLKKVINSVFKKHVDVKYPLEKLIENGLGGSQFLQSGVFTKDGQVIDHVVAMRNGNYPVSLQSKKQSDKTDKFEFAGHLKFVEDIVLPEDAKIVAIIVAKEEDYFRDPQILKSFVDLKVKHLAKKNYATVVVNFPIWNELPDREKIPYLMREIKQVFPENSAQKYNYS